ncbi:MAG: hypothetical protein NTU58_00625 [Candidatus Nealsonbacteria bacterium]|nr:hypothetical protein [Candidatus Nealsonbacteria bacterium]
MLKKKKWIATYVLLIINKERYESYREMLEKTPMMHIHKDGKMIPVFKALDPKIENGDRKEFSVFARTRFGAKREAIIKGLYANLVFNGNIIYKLESIVLSK